MSTTTKGWFDVDKDGLAKLLERRDKSFLLFELISNGWDADATRVDVTLQKFGHGLCDLWVTDDSPSGFADLRHAYTLFAESNRKSEAGKRGRFNLGEKIALALCKSAQIVTTTGGVHFGSDGSRRDLRERRERGSTFSAQVRMNASEYADALAKVQMLLPPVPTYFNGREIEPHELVETFRAALPTVGCREDGTLFHTERLCTVEVYEVRAGETAHVYELGVPVVETGDKYHVNVLQKVPLNMDRDNVTPAFLKAVRVEVLNRTHHLLADAAEATAPWVQMATDDERVAPEAVERAMDLRFGDKRVVYDPSDPEANALAVTKGYTVVSGGSLSAGQWDNVRKSGAILPAGKVTPSPKPFSDNGKPLKMAKDPPDVSKVKAIAEALVGSRVHVDVACDMGWWPPACYGPGHLTVNLAKVGRKWFTLEDVAYTMDLLVHELGHHYAMNHLSEDYYKALTKLAGRAVKLAIERPELFAGEVLS